MDVLLLTGHQTGVFFFFCNGIAFFQNLESGSRVVGAVFSAREVGLQGFQASTSLFEFFEYQGFEFLKVFIGLADLGFFLFHFRIFLLRADTWVRLYDYFF